MSDVAKVGVPLILYNALFLALFAGAGSAILAYRSLDKTIIILGALLVAYGLLAYGPSTILAIVATVNASQ